MARTLGTDLRLILMSRVSEGLAPLTQNEYLVMAGTLHGIHAITSRLSPAGNSSGAQVIEGESFKMTIHLTATGEHTYNAGNSTKPCIHSDSSQARNLCFLLRLPTIPLMSYCPEYTKPTPTLS